MSQWVTLVKEQQTNTVEKTFNVNSGTAVNWSCVVDGTGVIAFIHMQPQQYFNMDLDAKFWLKDPSGNTLVYKVGSGAKNSYSGSFTASKSGNYKLILQYEPTGTLAGPPVVSIPATSTGETTWVIDSTGPTISVDKTSQSWTNQNVGVNVSASDNSGVSSLQYRWSTSTATPSSWTSISNGATVTQSSNGKWYLHVRATDSLGNTRTTYYGQYKVDKTPPVAPNVTLVNKTSNSLSLSWTASDGLSGLDYVRIYVQKSNSENAHVADIDINGDGTTEYSLPIGTQTSYTVDGLEEYQYYRYYIRVYDNAGNYANDGYHLIITDDISGPVVSYDINSIDWVNTDINEVVNVDDTGGSGVANAYYKWTN